MYYENYRFLPWQAACSRTLERDGRYVLTTPIGGTAIGATGLELTTGVPLDGLCPTANGAIYSWYVPMLSGLVVTLPIDLTLDLAIDSTAVSGDDLVLRYAALPVTRGYGGTGLDSLTFQNADEALEIGGNAALWKNRMFTLSLGTIEGGTITSPGSALTLAVYQSAGSLLGKYRVLGLGLTYTASVPWD